MHHRLLNTYGHNTKSKEWFTLGIEFRVKKTSDNLLKVNPRQWKRTKRNKLSKVLTSFVKILCLWYKQWPLYTELFYVNPFEIDVKRKFRSFYSNHIEIPLQHCFRHFYTRNLCWQQTQIINKRPFFLARVNTEFMISMASLHCLLY